MFLLFLVCWTLVEAEDFSVANITQDAIPASIGSSPRNPSSSASEEVSARFFWKKKPKIYINGNGGGYGYSGPGATWTAYCQTCPSSYAYQCCQAGYSRCCYNRPPIINGGGKPGYCPQQPYPTSYYNTARCTVQCSTDNECPYDFKCCSVGCSYGCVRPEGTAIVPPKPGVCPPLPEPLKDEEFGGVYVPRNKPLKRSVSFAIGGNFNYAITKSHCYNDSECPGVEKCCSGVCIQVNGEFYPVRSYG